MLKAAGLSLSGVDLANLAAHGDVWENVAPSLKVGRCPPWPSTPDEATYESLVAHPRDLLDQIAATNPNPGRTQTFRRLTRTEYQNAIRDLLAVDVETDALLPADDSSFGFDNVTVGNLSPTLMEKYLHLLRKSAGWQSGVLFAAPARTSSRCPSTRRRSSISRTCGRHAGVALSSVHFPVDATYEFQVRLYRRSQRARRGSRPAGARQTQFPRRTSWS